MKLCAGSFVAVCFAVLLMILVLFFQLSPSALPEPGRGRKRSPPRRHCAFSFGESPDAKLSASSS